MKPRLALILPALFVFSHAYANDIYNFDIARNRGGVIYNADTDDCSLVWNTAAPKGTSTMTWNVFRTGTGNLSNGTVALTNLASSTGSASGIGISITPVNSDGYSDQTPKDGIWTSYMTTATANGSGPIITLSGFTAGETVNLVLYTGNARWSGANAGEFTFGGVTKSYLEDKSSNTMPLTEGLTYVRFNGLVADSNGEIIGTFGLGSTGTMAVLAGMQLEVISQDAYWDGSQTSWADATAWSLDSVASTPDPLDVPTSPFMMHFGATTISANQTVHLDSDPATKGLHFSSAYSTAIIGGNANHLLYLGSGGVSVNATSVAPTIGSTTTGEAVDLFFNASQPWTNESTTQPLVVHNQIYTDNRNWTLQGAGSFEFNDSIFSLASLTVNALGGAIMNGEVNAPATINSSSSVVINGNLTGGSTLRKLGAGSLTLNGTDTFYGSTTIDNGNVTVSGNRSAANGGWTLRGTGETGTAYNTVATTLNFAAGTTAVISSGQAIQVGNPIATGNFQQQSIQVAGSVTNNGTLNLGRASDLTINAEGTWIQNDAAIIATKGYHQAALNINGTGSFTYGSTTPLTLNASETIDRHTRISIDGGTFTTGIKIHNETLNLTSGNSAVVRFSNAATLRLSADIADLFTTAGASIEFEVNTGGGIIDTNGFSTTLHIPISGTGGLTKSGNGSFTTTASNTYSGDTTVNAGTLSLASPSLTDTSSVIVATDAVLNLNFTGADQIASLTLGGTALSAGTYDSTTHPAYLTGTGQLVVVAAAPPGFYEWATGLGLTGIATEDFDSDGLSDAVEYVIGSNPAAANANPVTTQHDGDNLIFTFTRDDRSETADLALSVEAGGDLATWSDTYQIGADTATSSAGVVVTENATAPDTISVTIPKNGSEKLFVRIKVNVNTP